MWKYVGVAAHVWQCLQTDDEPHSNTLLEPIEGTCGCSDVRFNCSLRLLTVQTAI